MSTTIVADFQLIQIAPLLDHLCDAVDRARAAAGADTRWLNAIDSAWGWLLEQDVVSYDHAAHALRVESATEAGKVYISNGTCQCRAFGQHNACWHRAAARLVRRALELEGMARASAEAAELHALAAELVAEAHAAGCNWYGAREGLEGARDRLPALRDFAAEWDAQAGALSARIGRAQARAMAAAA